VEAQTYQPALVCSLYEHLLIVDDTKFRRIRLTGHNTRLEEERLTTLYLMENS